MHSELMFFPSGVGKLRDSFTLALVLRRSF